MESALREALNHIMDLREQLANKKLEVSEATKATAERFDRKPAEINKLLGAIEKESQVGGEISTQLSFWDEVEGYFE